MLILINPISQLIATTAVVCTVPIIAVLFAALMMRQLRWFGYSWGDED